MTIDGIFDHTSGIPDAEIHQHYTALLSRGSAILFGRTTYQLMEYWRTIEENPTEDPAMNDFANAINKIPKVVFSNTLKNVDWENASIATQTLAETITALKQLPGKDLLIGSRSLIIQLLKLGLIDEFQLCIYPVVAGIGKPLFEELNIRTLFKLRHTKTFQGGAIMLFYEPVRINEMT